MLKAPGTKNSFRHQTVRYMKNKVTRVTIVAQDDKRTSLFPKVIVDDIEEYRMILKKALNAKKILLDTEETVPKIKRSST